MKQLSAPLLVLAASLLWATDALAQQQPLRWIQDDIDVYNMEVVRVDGRRLTVRVFELEGRRTFRVPQGFNFYIDDVPTDVTRLQPRQRLTAYVTRGAGGKLVLVDAGPPQAAVPAAPPSPPVIAEQAPEPVLPSTGSLVPLAGLAGLAMLGLAFGMRRLRQR